MNFLSLTPEGFIGGKVADIAAAILVVIGLIVLLTGHYIAGLIVAALGGLLFYVKYQVLGKPDIDPVGIFHSLIKSP